MIVLGCLQVLYYLLNLCWLFYGFMKWMCDKKQRYIGIVVLVLVVCVQPACARNGPHRMGMSTVTSAR